MNYKLGTSLSVVIKATNSVGFSFVGSTVTFSLHKNTNNLKRPVFSKSWTNHISDTETLLQLTSNELSLPKDTYNGAIEINNGAHNTQIKTFKFKVGLFSDDQLTSGNIINLVSEDNTINFEVQGAVVSNNTYLTRSTVSILEHDPSLNRFPTAGSNNTNNPTKFNYSQEQNVSNYSIKLSAQRLGLVNTWATATATKDEIASKVDDFVRELQTANRWNDFSDVLICASNKVSDFMTPLKGAANFSNNGFTDSDCSLELGIGDISNTSKYLSLPFTSYTIDCGAFLTTPIQGSLFGSYGSSAVGSNQELGLSMNDGLILDSKGYGRNIREICATSGWIRGSHNGGSMYAGYSNSLMVQTTNYFNSTAVAGADFTNTNITKFLFSDCPSVSNANKPGQFKIRILCYNAVGSSATDVPAIANNKVWSEATHKLDLALRSKQGNVLAVVGDSITSGYVYRDRDSIIPQIEINTGIKTLAIGRSGNPIRSDTSRNMLGMLQDYISHVRPLVNLKIVKYVAWNSGTNDMGYREFLPGLLLNNNDAYLQEQTRIAVELCITTAIADGIPIENQSCVGTLSSLPGGFGDLRNPVDRGIEQAANNLGVRYVPNSELGKSQPILSQNTWFSYHNITNITGDSVHPLPAGMRFFAKNFVNGHPKYSKIQKGDTYILTQNGTLGSTPVVIGDKLIALVNEPAQNLNNWRIEKQSITPTEKSVFVGYLGADINANAPIILSELFKIGTNIRLVNGGLDIYFEIGTYFLDSWFYGNVNDSSYVEIDWVYSSTPNDPIWNQRAAILRGLNSTSIETPRPYAQAELVVTSPVTIRLKIKTIYGTPLLYAGGSKIRITQIN